MGRLTSRRRIRRIDLGSGTLERIEEFAAEEPFEIRLGTQPLTVTMRTPGHDVELAHGLLLAEGIIQHRSDVRSARFCTDTELNVLRVELAEPGGVPISAQRRLVAHSGCGLCGKTSLDAISAADPPPSPPVRVPVEVLLRAPEVVIAEQSIFGRTGGVHGAALLTSTGEPLVVREDVGRHNAVDKVMGWALMNQRSRDDLVLVVSSRASFEIVQKAVMGGVGLLVCMSAPSTLAIEAADRFGLTLVAFAREERVTVCTHPHRVVG